MAPETDAPAAESTPEQEQKPKLSLQVKVDQPSTCKRHVTVTIQREDIDRYFQEAFDEFQPSAAVPGFRPGKAPRKLVESRFRDQVSNQVKGSLLMDSVTQASEECKFSAISEPDFDFGAIELPEEGPMTFEFDIEVRPEFELPEWKGLKLKRPVHDYSDEEVDAHLKKLLGRYGRRVDKDGGIEQGDQVTLSMVFKRGDETLSVLDRTTVTVQPKLSFNDATMENFGELLQGAQVGDTRTASVRISDEAELDELKGQEVAVELTVLAVSQLELPELTPAFLDRIGGFEDEEDLRDAVRGELERQLSYHQQRQIRDQIAEALTKDANWDLPEDLLRRQGRRELERAVLELRASGFSDDMIRTYENAIRQNSLNSTRRALKEHFIFERIAEDNNLEAEPQDYDAEIRLIAAQSGDSPRRVRARLEKRGQMDALRNQIVERKVIGLVTESAEFEDQPFEPGKEDTVGVDFAISGREDDEEIPDAKYGGDVEELPGAADRV